MGTEARVWHLAARIPSWISPILFVNGYKWSYPRVDHQAICGVSCFASYPYLPKSARFAELKVARTTSISESLVLVPTQQPRVGMAPNSRNILTT